MLNAGFAIAAAPPQIFPPPTSSMKSVHADFALLPGTKEFLQRKTPGTLTSASAHHVSASQVRAFAALDAAPHLSAERERIFWAHLEDTCDCNEGKRPIELAAKGKSCVATNCRLPKAKAANGPVTKPREQCCRCREHKWRKIYSPVCDSRGTNDASEGYPASGASTVRFMGFG